MTRHSFFGDKDVYDSVEDEARARFPLAVSVGKVGMGIPFSMFMPVDNMARFHFNRFFAEAEPKFLGPVMHAVQDASIPHHAAGLCGNWHGKYEEELDNKLLVWKSDPRFLDGVKFLFSEWGIVGDVPPGRLSSADWNVTPRKNWNIEDLVTWMALNSYREYADVYDHFRKGYVFVEKSVKALAEKAAAMIMLVICKAVSPDSRARLR